MKMERLRKVDELGAFPTDIGSCLKNARKAIEKSQFNGKCHKCSWRTYTSTSVEILFARKDKDTVEKCTRQQFAAVS